MKMVVKGVFDGLAKKREEEEIEFWNEVDRRLEKIVDKKLNTKRCTSSIEETISYKSLALESQVQELKGKYFECHYNVMHDLAEQAELDDLKKEIDKLQYKLELSNVLKEFLIS